MKKVLLLVFLSLTWLSASAQALVPITWTAYGLTFEVFNLSFCFSIHGIFLRNFGFFLLLYPY